MKFAYCLICFVCFAAPASAVDVHLYFLGGQSNGNGRANAADIPVGSPLASQQIDVALWYRNTQDGATNNTLPESQIIALAPGAGYGGSDPIYAQEFGPEVAFGRTLADALPNQNIMIVKHTYGGTNLHTQWSSTGSIYADFLVTANAAIDRVIANGDTPIPMGMIWVQGESDAGNTTNAANYGANLTDLIGRVRNDLFGGTAAPFVFNQLSDNQYNSLNSNHIALRNGQLSVSQTVANTAMVVTDDNALFTTIPSAIIHFDANGQINLGTALGNAMVELLTPTLIGDFTGDGDITLADYQVLLDNLQSDYTSMTAPEAYLRGDINGDRLVNLNDFLAFRTAYETFPGNVSLSAALAGTTNAVPEPHSIALATIVLLGGSLSLARWRHRVSRRWVKALFNHHLTTT